MNWTTAQEEGLRTACTSGMTYEAYGAEIGRSAAACSSKAHEMGFEHKYAWRNTGDFAPIGGEDYMPEKFDYPAHRHFEDIANTEIDRFLGEKIKQGIRGVVLTMSSMG